MPIEIRELIIKVKVEEDAGSAKAPNINLHSLKKQIVKEVLGMVKQDINKKVQR